MSLLSDTGARHDPPLNHNFMISLIDTSSPLAAIGSLALSAVLDVLVGGFTECSGLEMSMTPEEYKEGGRNGAVLKFPSRVTWSNLTLRKGVGIGTSLWDWHYGFVAGKGKRRDGVIVLLDATGLPAAMWYFSRGLPIKYSGPALNATQNNVAIESIEVAHEGLYQVPGIGIAGGAAALIGGLVS
ncbi:phage tail protein [Pseudoduganella umbonata]|nr:phage tail protein [Pseudoduganella umbonata]MBB3219837.1 phage tail-like protein [Pseudoduganella umbonata]